MKRFLTCLLLAVMLVTCMATTAFAAERGDEVVVEFKVSGNTGFGNLQVSMSYDKSALTFVKIEGAGISAGQIFMGGADIFGVMSASGGAVNGDGTVARVTFKVADGADLDTYTVSGTVDICREPDGVTDVPLSVSGGSVTVTCNHEWLTKEPTCATGGSKTCKKCATSETMDPTGNHSFNVLVEEAVEATCEADGKTAVYKCENCTTRDGGKVIEKKDHAWGEWSKTEGTCVVMGTETRICATCKTEETKDTTYGDHNYIEGTEVKGATCEDMGYIPLVCEHCGDEDKVNTTYGPHEYDNGNCIHCGQPEKEQCAHAWQWVVTKKVTCERDGEETLTCIHCGETSGTKLIKAKGHKWEWIVDKKPTGSADGMKHEECSECGAKRNEGTVIPKIEGLDDVPQTGDITNQITMSVAAVVVMMVAAVAFVFKRKAAK